MKTIIIAAALVFTTGILASQTTVSHAQPTNTTIQRPSISTDRKDLASGD
jgi:hypothetical protein